MQLAVAARFSRHAAPRAATVSLPPLKVVSGEAYGAMGVPASQRLRKQSEFQQIRSRGTRIHCGSFIFQCLQREAETSQECRLSVIASRRVGNAVKRNRGKRVFREIFRRHQGALPPRCDVVVVLRSSYDSHSYADLEARFLRACSSLKGTRNADGGQAAE